MTKYFKILICFALIFNLNNKAEALSGIGPIKFNNYTMDNFFAYLRGDGNPSGDVGARKGSPLSFAINPEGTVSHYYYCPLKFGSGACKSADTQAVQGCSKRSKARGYGRCKLFARGYKVVWGGANIKFSRKFDEQVVRTIFQQNGWYEEFSNRPPSSGSGENKYIQKKKDKKNPNVVKKSKNDNIVEEIKELKKLLDEGILTEDEFKDAKKKLLN